MKIEVKNPSDKIQESRPNLKENTIKQYQTNLNKLQKLFDSDNWNFLSDPKNVMEKLEHLHFLSKRNHLNAIIVLLMALNSEEKYDKILEEYGNFRDELNTKYDEEQKSGIISDKQSKNFTTIEEVYKMINKMGEELKPIKKKKTEDLSSKERALLQVYTLFSIYARMPMRNGVSLMEAINKRSYNKLSEKEKKEKNYLVIVEAVLVSFSLDT